MPSSILAQRKSDGLISEAKEPIGRSVETNRCYFPIRLVARIVASHAIGPGSIPGLGKSGFYHKYDRDPGLIVKRFTTWDSDFLDKRVSSIDYSRSLGSTPSKTFLCIHSN